MNESEFSIGDVVALKSGGATMVVNDINETQVYCTWMNDQNSVERDSFDVRLLGEPWYGDIDEW